MKLKIPNILTIGRIIIVPIFVLTFFIPGFFGDLIPFFLFALASFTDYLDGLLARIFKEESKLGELLDPIADKFLIVSSIVLLGYNGYVPIWLIIIIVSRDIAIFGAVIISWMLGTNLRIEPLIISKINTFLQIFYIVITFLVILNNQLLTELTISIHGITTYLIAISTILSWMSYLKVWLINVNSVNKNY